MKFLKFLTLTAGMLCCFAFAQKKTTFKTINYGNNPTAGKYASVNGINIYYETYGKGEPLLLLHGNGGSIENFKNQIAYFSKKFKVIAVDSRAQGKSIDHGTKLNYQMMSEDFNALLDALNIESTNIIGWSDGGINGLLLAMNHPEKVKKLVISGANLNTLDINFNPKTTEAIQSDLVLLKKAPQDSETINKLKVVGMLTKEPNIDSKQLAEIKAPVLVIGGDNDAITVEHTVQIFRSIPNANLWILPSAGHATMQHYKDEFNTKVSKFLTAPFAHSKWDDWD